MIRLIILTVKSYGVKKVGGEQSFADLIYIVFSSNLRSVKSFVKYTTRRAREIAETAIRTWELVLIAKT